MYIYMYIYTNTALRASPSRSPGRCPLCSIAGSCVAGSKGVRGRGLVLRRVNMLRKVNTTLLLLLFSCYRS